MQKIQSSSSFLLSSWMKRNHSNTTKTSGIVVVTRRPFITSPSSHNFCYPLCKPSEQRIQRQQHRLDDRTPNYDNNCRIRKFHSSSSLLLCSTTSVKNENATTARATAAALPTAATVTQVDEKRQQIYEELRMEQEQLLLQAKKITLSLYRIIIRSIRMIRHGNDYDEQEFARREEEEMMQLENRQETIENIDPRLDMLSMLPPVNRKDELRSRADYYSQYSVENIVTESDCLSLKSGGYNYYKNNNNNRKERSSSSLFLLWNDERTILNYVSYIRRGYEHRKWLLSDMKFTADPYRKHVQENLLVLQQFELTALQYIQRVYELENHHENEQQQQANYSSISNSISAAAGIHDVSSSNHDNYDSEDDGWDSDDDNS